MNTADAIIRTLESPNVSDANMENANVVDVLAGLASAARRIANAITLPDIPGKDADDNGVGCLTEAIMGITSGLIRVAESISDLAESVKQRR